MRNWHRKQDSMTGDSTPKARKRAMACTGHILSVDGSEWEADGYTPIAWN